MNPTCIKKLEDKMNDVDSKCRNALLKMIYSSGSRSISLYTRFSENFPFQDGIFIWMKINREKKIIKHINVIFCKH